MTDDVHSPALKAREKWLVISPDTEESRAAYRDQRERLRICPAARALRGGRSNSNGPERSVISPPASTRNRSIFGQFKSDWPSRLPLSHRCTVRRVSARSDIHDLDRDDVTATELAVDRQIEHGEVPSAAFDLEFGPDRPDVFGSQRRLRPGQLALVQGTRLWGVGVAFT
jgi:hypothetical protein